MVWWVDRRAGARPGSSGVGTRAGVPRLGEWPRILSLGGAALGLLGLVGAWTGRRELTTLVPGQPAMMPITALSLLVSGVAGALLHGRGRGRRVLAVVAGLLVLAGGAA